jgi:vacuolar-type H+-ATPase subunit B/Vma2
MRVHPLRLGQGKAEQTVVFDSFTVSQVLVDKEKKSKKAETLNETIYEVKTSKNKIGRQLNVSGSEQDNGPAFFFQQSFLLYSRYSLF